MRPTACCFRSLGCLGSLVSHLMTPLPFQMMSWWWTRRCFLRLSWGTLWRSLTPTMNTGERETGSFHLKSFILHYTESCAAFMPLSSPLLLQVKSLKEDLQKGNSWSTPSLKTTASAFGARRWPSCSVSFCCCFFFFFFFLRDDQRGPDRRPGLQAPCLSGCRY